MLNRNGTKGGYYNQFLLLTMETNLRGSVSAEEDFFIVTIMFLGTLDLDLLKVILLNLAELLFMLFGYYSSFFKLFSYF